MASSVYERFSPKTNGQKPKLNSENKKSKTNGSLSAMSKTVKKINNPFELSGSSKNSPSRSLVRTPISRLSPKTEISFIPSFSDGKTHSSKTQQFLDILDIATGNKPASSFLNVKDRIGSLIKNATQKTWGKTHSPKLPDVRVKKIVSSVETRNKRSPDPEVIHRKRFVPTKGVLSDVKASKNAGKWKSKVSKDNFVHLPEPSFKEKLRSHMNTILETPKMLFNKEAKQQIPEEEDFEDVICDSPEPEASLNTFSVRSCYIPTSACTDIDDSGFDFEELDELFIAKAEKEVEQSIKISHEEIVTNGHEETVENIPEMPIPTNIYNGHEEKNEICSKTELSSASINDFLVTQCEISSRRTSNYFLEEECVMLSPYSNEAMLYKLLFPGKKIPILQSDNNIFSEFNSEEYAAEFHVEALMGDVCSETTVLSELRTSTVGDDVLVLFSPYADDMWESASSEEDMLVDEPEEEVIEEIEPELEFELLPPLVEEEVQEVTQDIHIEEPRAETPEIIREPTPPPPIPKPKAKRPMPEKTKKVYDRNFVKAVQMNQTNVVEDMINAGADPDTSCSIGNVLHQAAQLGFKYTVQTLIWGGANMELRNELGDTALHIAAIAGFNDIVFELTAYECEVHPVNNYLITPLHMALSYGRLNVVQTLVRMGADIYAEDKIGDTPITLCEQLGYPVDALDSKSAEKGPLKEIPLPLQLVQAVENGATEDVQSALSKHVHPSTIVPLAVHWPGHSTVLHMASHLGHKNIVDKLLQYGGKVQETDDVGNTPLHTAVQDGHEEVSLLLLQYGADPNAVTQSGVTPLHRAAAKGYASTLDVLLKYGGDLTIEDNQGRTPIDWARKKGFMVLARNLQKRSN